MSCGVGCRHGLDLVWLWYRPEAVALTGPLAWEPPYAVDATLKRHTHEKAMFFLPCQRGDARLCVCVVRNRGGGGDSEQQRQTESAG